MFPGLQQQSKDAVVPGQMMRVLRTGRFSLLVVKGVMEKEPQDCVLRLTRLSGGEQGDLATAKTQTQNKTWANVYNTLIRHSNNLPKCPLHSKI